MKLLEIYVEGLPLFNKGFLDLPFYAMQRVQNVESDSGLYNVFSNVYLNCTEAIVGINASGKTSVLRVVLFALDLLQNKSINNIYSKNILGDSEKVSFDIYFYSSSKEICKLEIWILPKKDNIGNVHYIITEEKLWIKKILSITAKNNFKDFSGIEPVQIRSKLNSMQDFLPEDVSMIIAYNKKNGENLNVVDMLYLTNINFLPYSFEISKEIIEFLDPTIEYLTFEKKSENSQVAHLKFRNGREIRIEKPSDLVDFLSSGTVKGISVFEAALVVLSCGGYLVIDEIENHFNREIVATLLRFFMDKKINKNGAVLIYSTHYPELLDEHERSDSIYITNNPDGIAVENFSNILKRNDIKKSDVYQSGYLEKTAPSYDAYLKVKSLFKNI